VFVTCEIEKVKVDGQDEALGPNKPFRDIAWGVASRGIAVLRYNKRSYEHPMSAKVANLTLNDEARDDAVSAAALLRGIPEINPQKIFVLGHSLGAVVAPRIAKAHPAIAGLILEGGIARPYLDLLLTQIAAAKQMEELKQQIARANDPNLKPGDPASRLPFGAPATYWLDGRGYRPAELARELKQPILILPGERDYRAAMEDFALWKQALSDRKNVEFEVYPKLNHFFIEGERHQFRRRVSQARTCIRRRCRRYRPMDRASGEVLSDDGVGARYDLGLTPFRIVAQPYFEPAREELRFLPEGPRVLRNHPGGALLGWVAIQHAADLHEGSFNVLDLVSGRNTTYPLPGRPGFFAETTRPGVVLIGLERRLVGFDLLTGDLEETGIQVTRDERVIINDGLAVDGGVLFGTKHLEFNQRIAALYFFDSATRRVHTVIGGEICSNGKFLRRDAQSATLIEIDSTPKTITRYRLDARLERVLEQSLVTAADALPAIPDGLRPSPAGENGPGGESVIVAFYNPGAVADGVAQQLRVSDGAVLCEWRIPGSPRVTCPEFVEVEGKVKLVFTTAVEGMPAATRRLAFGAGNMYIADTPFHKMPAPPPLVSM